MIEQAAGFYSDGAYLDGTLYLPDKTIDPTGNASQSKPVVITCSGFLGLKDIHPARVARSLTKRGYSCFGFDYRGFGKSHASGSASPQQQAQDIADALSYLSERPGTCDRRLVTIGWGMGAGLLIDALRIAPLSSALITINGFYNWPRLQETIRGRDGWHAYRSWLLKERARATQNGQTPRIDPFFMYPLDTKTRDYVDDVLCRVPGFGGKVPLGFASSLMLFAPDNNLSHLKDVPILIVHGARNELHPPAEAQHLYDAYPGPKTLHWLEDAGHTEWMLDGHPRFEALAEQIDQWIATCLQP
jgi:alpha-beta hydrolase superfamily lysophospholipase